jgi:hypothetical protein
MDSSHAAWQHVALTREVYLLVVQLPPPAVTR